MCWRESRFLRRRLSISKISVNSRLLQMFPPFRAGDFIAIGGTAFIKAGKAFFMTTTNEIADKIAAEQSLTKTQAKAIVESVFKQIGEAAQSGVETSIPAFGKFKVKETPEREGRNPATGATIKIAASKKLTFAPAKAIKDALNG
jgi:DNA-binding protein HU-beta